MWGMTIDRCVQVSETLSLNSALTRLISREDFRQPFCNH
jgi:hypothetical protein